MKPIIIIFFFLTTANLFAQQDTTAVKKKDEQGYISKIREKLKNVGEKLTPDAILKNDTVKTPQKQTLDSATLVSRHKLDSIKAINITKGLSHRADSLKSGITHPVDSVTQKITGVESNLQHKLSNAEVGVSNTEQKLTSVPAALQHKTDSIQNSAQQVNKKVEDVEHKIQSKADSVQNKATLSLNKVEGKLKEVTDDKAVIPGADKLNAQGVKIPELKTQGVDVPGTFTPSLNEKLPDLKLDNVSKDVTKEIPKIEGVDVSKGLPTVKDGLPKMDLPNKPELGDVKELSGEVKKLDGSLAEGEKYEKELGNIKKMDEAKLEKQAENKLQNVDQIKGVHSEITNAQKIKSQQEELIKKYKDQKSIEAEVKRKAANVANDYLAQNAVAVKKAEATLAKSKKGVSRIKSFGDIFKRRSDELEGKKFYQRLIPGITLQTFRGEVISMDAALQLGYRFTPRLTAGIGGLCRLGFDKRYDYIAQYLGVNGYRFYMDYSAYKSVFLHAEGERLKLEPQRMLASQSKELTQNHVYGSYVGLGKRINISRHIKGSIMGLYRINYDGKLPNVNKVTVRIGFDYVFRKGRKLIAPIK